MSKTYALEADGALTVSEKGAQLNEVKGPNVLPAVDGAGNAIFTYRTVTIRPEQIAAHCRDAAFVADLNANAPADVKQAVLNAIAAAK